MKHSQTQQRSPTSDLALPRLSMADRRSMLQVASTSIVSALTDPLRQAPDVDPLQYPITLRQPRATFVTLHCQGQLRGCRGSITATTPMIVDVAHSARAAACFDERFPPVCVSEVDALELHLSILGPLRPLAVTHENELLDSLRVGRDGLVVRTGTRQALFLPAMWKKLPEPLDFVAQLKAKAGLSATTPTSSLTWQRFEVEEIPGRCTDFLR